MEAAKANRPRSRLVAMKDRLKLQRKHTNQQQDQPDTNNQAVSRTHSAGCVMVTALLNHNEAADEGDLEQHQDHYSGQVTLRPAYRPCDMVENSQNHVANKENIEDKQIKILPAYPVKGRRSLRKSRTFDGPRDLNYTEKPTLKATGGLEEYPIQRDSKLAGSHGSLDQLGVREEHREWPEIAGDGRSRYEQSGLSYQSGGSKMTSVSASGRIPRSHSAAAYGAGGHGGHGGRPGGRDGQGGQDPAAYGAGGYEGRPGGREGQGGRDPAGYARQDIPSRDPAMHMQPHRRPVAPEQEDGRHLAKGKDSAGPYRPVTLGGYAGGPPPHHQATDTCGRSTAHPAAGGRYGSAPHSRGKSDPHRPLPGHPDTSSRTRLQHTTNMQYARSRPVHQPDNAKSTGSGIAQSASSENLARCGSDTDAGGRAGVRAGVREGVLEGVREGVRAGVREGLQNDGRGLAGGRLNQLSRPPHHAPAHARSASSDECLSAQPTAPPPGEPNRKDTQTSHDPRFVKSAHPGVRIYSDSSLRPPGAVVPRSRGAGVPRPQGAPGRGRAPGHPAPPPARPLVTAPHTGGDCATDPPPDQHMVTQPDASKRVFTIMNIPKPPCTDYVDMGPSNKSFSSNSTASSKSSDTSPLAYTIGQVSPDPGRKAPVVQHQNKRLKAEPREDSQPTKSGIIQTTRGSSPPKAGPSRLASMKASAMSRLMPGKFQARGGRRQPHHSTPIGKASQPPAEEFKKPPSVLTESSNGLSQASRKLTQPASRISKASTGSSHPSSRLSQPPSGLLHLSSKLSQPSIRLSQPSQPPTGLLQPSSGLSQPSSGLSQPSSGLRQPSSSLRQPSSGLTQHSIGLKPLSRGLLQPSGGLSHPPTGLKHSSTGLKQPSIGLSQPPSGLSQPSSGLSQPSSGLSQPSSGLSQPPSGLSQPSPGLSQPSSGQFSQPAISAISELDHGLSMLKQEFCQMKSEVGQPSDGEPLLPSGDHHPVGGQPPPADGRSCASGRPPQHGEACGAAGGGGPHEHGRGVPDCHAAREAGLPDVRGDPRYGVAMATSTPQMQLVVERKTIVLRHHGNTMEDHDVLRRNTIGQVVSARATKSTSGLRVTDPTDLKKAASPRQQKNGHVANGNAGGKHVPVDSTNPRRHTLTVGELNGTEMGNTQQGVTQSYEQQREQFFEHLAHQYPEHAHIISPRSPQPPPSRAGECGRYPAGRGGAYGGYEADEDRMSTHSEAETSPTGGFQRGGRLRTSLPVVRSPNKSLEKPLGLVFLIFRNETKRALLPNEVTSLDTVRALFVRSFQDQLGMAYFDGRRKIYVMDPNTNVFYELEDLRDVKDRAVLKIYETEAGPAAGSPARSPVHERLTGLPYPGAGGGGAGPGGYKSDSSARSAPPCAGPRSPGPHPPGQHPSGPHPAAASAAGGGQRPYSQEVAGTVSSLPYGYQGPYAGGTGVYGTLGGGQGPAQPWSPSHHPHPQAFTHSNQNSPQRTATSLQPGIPANQRHSLAYLPDPATYQEGALPQSRSYHDYKESGSGRSSGSVTPTHVEGASRNRMEKMEAQLASLTAWVQSAVVQREDGGGRPGSARSNASSVVSEGSLSAKSTAEESPVTSDKLQVREEMEHRSILVAPSPRQTKKNGRVTFGIAPPSAPPGQLLFSESDSTTPIQSPTSSTHQGMSDVSSVTPQPMISVEMQTTICLLQQRAKEIRGDVTKLRRQQLSNTEMMRETIHHTCKLLKGVIEGVPGASDLPVRTQRRETTVQIDSYQTDSQKVEQDLHDLEASVDELRGDVLNRHCRVNSAEVEGMALALSNVAKQLGDLKVRFPNLQKDLKTVMQAEMEVVVKEERFLKEEPDRVDIYLKRCKRLTGVLTKLKRLAEVQGCSQPRVAAIATVTELDVDDRLAVLENIKAIVPNHDARVQGVQEAESSRERKKKLTSATEQLRIEKTLEVAQRQLKETKHVEENKLRQEQAFNALFDHGPGSTAGSETGSNVGSNQGSNPSSNVGSNAGSNAGSPNEVDEAKIAEEAADKVLVNQSAGSTKDKSVGEVCNGSKVTGGESPPQKPPRTLNHVSGLPQPVKVSPPGNGGNASTNQEPASQMSANDTSLSLSRLSNISVSGSMISGPNMTRTLSPSIFKPPDALPSTSTPKNHHPHVTFSAAVTEIPGAAAASTAGGQEAIVKPKKVPPPPPPRKSSSKTIVSAIDSPPEGIYENIENLNIKPSKIAYSPNGVKGKGQRPKSVSDLQPMVPLPNKNGANPRPKSQYSPTKLPVSGQLQSGNGIYAVPVTSVGNGAAGCLKKAPLATGDSDSGSSTSLDSQQGTLKRAPNGKANAAPSAISHQRRSPKAENKGKKVPPPPPLRKTSTLSKAVASGNESVSPKPASEYMSPSSIAVSEDRTDGNTDTVKSMAQLQAQYNKKLQEMQKHKQSNGTSKKVANGNVPSNKSGSPTEKTSPKTDSAGKKFEETEIY